MDIAGENYSQHINGPSITVTFTSPLSQNQQSKPGQQNAMPLVKLDIIRGARTPEQIKTLADTVQATLEAHFAAPKHDRYQIITQHEPYELICEDTGLGYKRSEKLVFVHVFQQGRTAEKKQEFYGALMAALKEKEGLRGEDLIISCARNEKEDWSFGEGRAQFLDGGL